MKESKIVRHNFAMWFTFLFASIMILIIASSMFHYSPGVLGGTLIDDVGAVLPFALITAIAEYYLLKPRRKTYKGPLRETTKHFPLIIRYFIAMFVGLFLSIVIYVFFFLPPIQVGEGSTPVEPIIPGAIGGRSASGLPEFDLWLVFSILVIAFAVGTMLIATLLKKREEHIEEIVELEEKVGESITSGVNGFADDEYRRAIITYYAQGRELIASQGVPSTETTTAREFEKNVLGSIKVAGKDFTPLTDLFEEARFSVHPMGAPKKHQAGKHYDKLKKITQRKGMTKVE